MSKESILKFAFTAKEVKELQLQQFEAVTEGIRTRKNEANLTIQERSAFRDAITRLITNGTYNKLVNIHEDMSHDMHGRMHGHVSSSGVQRFLAWHRAYLLELEIELQKINPAITIPYWEWSKNNRFPEWLADFLPQNLTKADGETYNVERNIGVDETNLPSKESVKQILNINNYTNFSLALEGWQPYGAHNQVHVWVGGTMGTLNSPADPIFWLHHCEIDRLWSIWQMNHANEHPSLLDRKAIMDPWTYRYKDISIIPVLNYIYEEMQL
jgi:tyrosinase